MMYPITKPKGWMTIQERKDGIAVQHPGKGLRVIISIEPKEDGHTWLHVSCSTGTRKLPSHEDMCFVKDEFIGDKYAYIVFPPKEFYVNINPVLHMWHKIDESNGKVLPEMSGIVPGVGRSI